MPGVQKEAQERGFQAEGTTSAKALGLECAWSFQAALVCEAGKYEVSRALWVAVRTDGMTYPDSSLDGIPLSAAPRIGFGWGVWQRSGDSSVSAEQ